MRDPHRSTTTTTSGWHAEHHHHTSSRPSHHSRGTSSALQRTSTRSRTLWEYLESCVASLRDGTAAATTSGSPQDAPALRVYEGLRRELGLALRKCERGREPLLELLLPSRVPSPDEDEVPALGLMLRAPTRTKRPSHPCTHFHPR